MMRYDCVSSDCIKEKNVQATIRRGKRNCNHSTLIDCGQMIEKEIEPSFEWTMVLAVFFCSAMQAYYNALKACGVPVPGEYKTEYFQEDGRVSVIETAENMGPDCEAFLRGGGDPGTLIRMILASIQGVLENDSVGIDPDPANFCIKGGKAVFIDFHPPRCYFNGEYLVGFPQPAGDEARNSYNRYYTPLGALRRLEFHLMRICGVQVSDLFQAELEKVLSTHLWQVWKEDVMQRPLQRIRIGGDPVEVVEALGLANIDDLRELALHYGCENVRRELFALTTADFRIPLDERLEKLAKAKHMVLCSMGG